MNDLQIKCFLAAAKYENFTKAAETLYLSQPVLGRHVANLESELGFELFHRSRKTVRLTENGRIFQEFLIETTQKYDQVMDRIRTNLRSNTMHLKLGTAEGQLIGDCYSNAFKYIVDNRPELNVSISYFLNNDLLDNLSREIIDAAITDDTTPNLDAFCYEPIKRLRVGVVAPTDHPATLKKNISLNDFSDSKFIMLCDNPDPRFIEAQELSIKRFGITEVVKAYDISTFCALAEAGVGVTTVPENHRLCYSPNLVFLTFPELPTVAEVIVWNKNNTNPAVSIFCDILKLTGYQAGI